MSKAFVPLFSGGARPQSFDNFQLGFVWDEKGKLRFAPLRSKRKDKRRKGERRKKEEQKGKPRRLARRYSDRLDLSGGLKWCRFCDTTFPTAETLALHPCPKFYKRVRWGLLDRVEKLRRPGGPSIRDVEPLRKILLDSFSRAAYMQWLGDVEVRHSFCDRASDGEAHWKRFCLYKWASFVEVIRPGELDWRTPKQADMELAEKGLTRFLEFDAPRQREMLRRFFNTDLELETVLDPSCKRWKLNLSGLDVAKLRPLLVLRPRAFAEKIGPELSQKIFGSPDAVQLWRDDPDSFRGKLRRLRGRYLPRRSASSSP